MIVLIEMISNWETWSAVANRCPMVHNNTPGHPVDNHFNKNNHTANDLKFYILKGHFKSNKKRQLCEQKLIAKYNCNINGLNKDKSFLVIITHFLTYNVNRT